MTAPAIIAGNPAMTYSIGIVRRLIGETLRARGVESPELDARLLIGHALGLDHAKLAAASQCILAPSDIEAIHALTARRCHGEPVARILGVKEFWGLSLRLSPATLVPRPETETVVEAALDAVRRQGVSTRMLRLADLGTGSGALLLALLSELPAACGAGTDVSPAALATARDNAARLALGQRAHFIACDFGAALASDFDLIVSNPPYVATRDIATLAPEVRDHDPLRALDGGADGLSCYRAIATHARRLLAPAGFLVVEIGTGQAERVTECMACASLSLATEARPDLAGIPRALTFRHGP